MYSCSKCLAHPSRWMAGLSVWKFLSFCHSLEHLKFFSLPFWGILIDNIMYRFDYVKINFVLKMLFFLILTLILFQSLISSIVICDTIVESWDHIIFPTLSILFPYLQTLNKVFYFNNDEKEEERIKSFKRRKFNSPLNVQVSKKKYHKPFKSNSWSESENLDGLELKLQPWF